MTNKKLKEYMDEYILEQDNQDHDESYSTNRADAHGELFNFVKWLQTKGIRIESLSPEVPK